MNRVTYYLTIAVCLFAAVSCKEHRRFRIGVSQCSQDDWRAKMNEEIYREIMFHPEAEVEIRSADDSNEKQIADIRYFADNGFDIIVAAPNEAAAITPVIKEVYDSGLPVIVFDRGVNGDSYTTYYGVDNRGMGEAAAEYAVNMVGDGGKVLEIYGLKGSTPAIDRHEGFKSKATGLDVLAIGYGNWNPEDAARVADSLLAAHPDAQLIYAHNDRMAIAASEVARRRGVKLKVIGIDAAPDIGIKAVADSVIDATFLYPTDGYKLVRTALDILNGKPVPKNLLLPLSSAVDATNADILLLQNEQIKEESRKIQVLKSQVDDYLNRHSAQTTLFYAVVAILVLLFGLMFVLLRSFWQHKRHQLELLEQNKLLEQQRDTEKALNERLSEATQSKLMFFTNVSHDLRTPLTLIAEPVEQLMKSDNLTPRQRTLVGIANKNIKILRRLINQILDFRKYENDKLPLVLSEVKVGRLIEEWAEAFVAVARKKDIKLSVEVSVAPDFTIAMDVEKIERVFFNLVSNAIKYTPANGRVHLMCGCDGENITFSVDDTGEGIAVSDIDNIFDRFYQVEKVHPKGSGIGLSLAKAFVEMHGGTISVDSTVGEGSKFTVSLPVKHVDSTPLQGAVPGITSEEVEEELGQVVGTSARQENGSDGNPLMLVIDDNDDIRLMIRELLGDEYRIIEASNGKSGIRMASRFVPDIIICDVMMPVMDGLECCKRIKDEISTSHVPVLMLTACSRDEQRTMGYKSGADGYLAKPFDSAMLRMRCLNLIENRKRVRNLWSSDTSVAASPPSLSGTDNVTPPAVDMDSEFYNRFLEEVRRDMGNPDLSVDLLAGKMGLGRSQFYRKIKALTNYSPVELIRSLRLKQAHELLTATEKTVSEIAYEVGFSSPAYFTRCYRDAYGETPSEARSRLGR